MANPVIPLRSLITWASWTGLAVSAVGLGGRQVAAALIRGARWRP
jgi:hypothetical protein